LAVFTESWLVDNRVAHKCLVNPKHNKVTVNDSFWAPRLELYRNTTLDDVFSKFENAGAVRNFDRLANQQWGSYEGPSFFDGQFYEVIRAACDILATEYSYSLDNKLDGYITKIAAAASVSGDGYINTYTQLKEPDHRWGENGGNLLALHDVYNAGFLVDAGVHHYQATGKKTLLEVAFWECY